jgi:hypothetical protein
MGEIWARTSQWVEVRHPDRNKDHHNLHQSNLFLELHHWKFLDYKIATVLLHHQQVSRVVCCILQQLDCPCLSQPGTIFCQHLFNTCITWITWITCIMIPDLKLLAAYNVSVHYNYSKTRKPKKRVQKLRQSVKLFPIRPFYLHNK